MKSGLYVPQTCPPRRDSVIVTNQATTSRSSIVAELESLLLSLVTVVGEETKSFAFLSRDSWFGASHRPAHQIETQDGCRPLPGPIF
jgi:hypothetical protein